jgi:hypothetical protein
LAVTPNVPPAYARVTPAIVASEVRVEIAITPTEAEATVGVATDVDVEWTWTSCPVAVNDPPSTYASVTVWIVSLESAPAADAPSAIEIAAATLVVVIVGVEVDATRIFPFVAVTDEPLMKAWTPSEMVLSATKTPTEMPIMPADRATETIVADSVAVSSASTVTTPADFTLAELLMDASTSFVIALTALTPAPAAPTPRPPANAAEAATATAVIVEDSVALTRMSPVRASTLVSAFSIEAWTVLPIELFASVTPTATATATGPKAAATETAAATALMVDVSWAVKVTLSAMIPVAPSPSM